jgi:lipid-A-disaccharide synthase
VQENATPEKLADAVIDLLADGDKREAIEAEFALQHAALKCNTAERMAEAVLPFLERT